MNVAAVALWTAGLVLIAFALAKARGPQARLSELDRLAENARRYDSWRGGRKTAAGGEGESGADVMRALLRRQVQIWIGVGVAGTVLLVAGFFVS
ncbi:hypothetical protein BH23CHL7_BH23CHL7_06020 [soil metagenome]